MLKRKPKKCEGCGLMKPIWSKGLCMDCSKSSYGTLKKTTSLKKTVKGKSKEVKDFYQRLVEHYNSVGGRSEESFTPINPVTAVNLAHILPKEDFPEVATNPYNIIVLTWEEHTRFDELLSRHEFEKLEEELPRAWSKATYKLRFLLTLIKNQNKLTRALENYLDV